jgi:hypothetical protein
MRNSMEIIAIEIGENGVPVFQHLYGILPT